jgi:tyrosyl-tRNA synthetase
VASTIYNELEKRGFIKQVTDPEPLRELFKKERVTFYVGIDPTADSLHAGHLVSIMGMAHMQRFGHRPIAILGSGTAMVGDPSGKTDMRKMLTREQIVENGKSIKKQLGRYLDFSGDRAILVDNYDWLGGLNYIEFLRDIGRHFSVNRMLTFETYKMRLEKGLSFLEFNYQLLQAFDYLELYRRYGCRLQMGGDDQWANILAGTDLIRRVEGVDAYGLTWPLLETSSGAKMGKTEAGALWLDAARTSPYDYYQYWVNTDDRDVGRFLAIFTLLPLDEIEAVERFSGAELNAAKAILAFEATELTHGREEAKKALRSAAATFGGREIPASMLPSSSIPRGQISRDDRGVPSSTMDRSRLQAGLGLVDLLAELELVSSKSEARRLIQQGGIYVNEKRVKDIGATVDEASVSGDRLELRIGKKKHFYLNLR